MKVNKISIVKALILVWIVGCFLCSPSIKALANNGVTGVKSRRMQARMLLL